MKRLLAMILCVAMVLSFAVGTAAASEAKKTLTVAITGDPGTFYPYYNLSGNGRSLYTPVYEAMFFYDENTTPTPVLAEDWKIDDDDLGITIKLKEGVLFHDGSEMKASDVLFSVKCILDCNWARNIGDIDLENSYAVDDYTVYLRYKTVQGPLLYMLCNLYILSEAYQTSVPAEDWTFNCIGTGAYKWGQYTVGSEYHLMKFDGYREEKALEEIIIRIIPEASVQAVELEIGSIDLALGLSYKDIFSFQEDENSGFKATWGPAIGSFAIYSSIKDAPYNSTAVRQAFAYALDLESINKVAYNGLAAAATNIYAYGVPVWEQAPNLRTYDPEKAKALLADAGYPDGIELELIIVNTTAGNEAAEVMIASCAKAGINLKVTSVDTATLYAMQNSGASGFFMSVYYTNGDPYIMLNSYVSDTFGVMRGFNVDPLYNESVELYAEAMKYTNDAERFVIYRELMGISYDNAFCIPVIDTCDVGVHPASLEGYWMGGPAYHYEDCYWVK